MIILNQSQINFDSVLPDGFTVPGEEASNIVSTEIINLSKEKTTSNNVLKEGDSSIQTVVIKNPSNQELSNLFFNDTMSDGATFENQSVTIDGISFPLHNPISGFSLPNLISGGNVTVTYNITANNPKTNENVLNFATLNYSVEDPVRGPVNYAENSNTVNILLVAQDVKIIALKSVDKDVAYEGDTLHYQTIITNNGSQTIKNIDFKDTLSPDVNFVINSVKINGISYLDYNPSQGFNLPELESNKSINVEFDVDILQNIENNIVNNIALIEVQSDGTILNFPTNEVTTFINKRNQPLISYGIPINKWCLPCKIDFCCKRCHCSKKCYKKYF